MHDIYDVWPQVLRWDGRFFLPLQNLTHSFATILDPVDANMSAHSPSSIGLLRGIADIEPFRAADGEEYIAIATSVCDSRPTIASVAATCVANAEQPRSAILQWDRSAGMFGEFLAVTDQTYLRIVGKDVPDNIRRHHQVYCVEVPVQSCSCRIGICFRVLVILSMQAQFLRQRL